MASFSVSKVSRYGLCGKTRLYLGLEAIMPVTWSQSRLAPKCPLSLTHHYSQEVTYPHWFLLTLSILVHMAIKSKMWNFLKVPSPIHPRNNASLFAGASQKWGPVSPPEYGLPGSRGALERGPGTFLAGRQPEFHFLSNQCSVNFKSLAYHRVTKGTLCGFQYKQPSVLETYTTRVTERNTEAAGTLFENICPLICI